MELVISLALISVILVFMMRLLIDLNDEETNNDFAKNNQINRAEIIRVIQNDLDKKIIKKIEDNSEADFNNKPISIKIEFKFSDGTKSSITAKDKSLEYVASTGSKRVWEMKDCTIFINKANINYIIDDKEDVSSRDTLYTLLLDIEIHTTNDNNKENNNNTLDDILISYMGKIDELESGFDNLSQVKCIGTYC